MIKELDDFYLGKPEPARSCLLALREIILHHDAQMTEAMKYGMPFFFLGKKRICYLWVEKKSGFPYIGIVDAQAFQHPKLIAGDRTRMKVFMVDPLRDLPIRTIDQILKLATRSR